MHIVLTGANGFIGRNVLNILLKKKHKVTILIRDRGKLKKFCHKNLKVILSNIYEDKKIINKIPKADILIHLAWQNLTDFNNKIHITKNVNSNYFFIKKCISKGIKNILVTGTCLEYGLREGCLGEKMFSRPNTYYGKSKYKLYSKLNKINNINLKWLRLFYIYGEGDSKNNLYTQLINSIKQKKTFKMSKGDQLRDFIEVKSLSNLIHKISQSKMNGIFNCCSGKPVSVLNFVKSIIKKRQSKIKIDNSVYDYPYYEPKNFWGSTKKIKKIN